MKLEKQAWKFSAAKNCHRCDTALELDNVHLPKLGLVQVICSHCKHQHLFSAWEIEKARGQMSVISYVPERVGFLHQVVRFLVG